MPPDLVRCGQCPACQARAARAEAILTLLESSWEDLATGRITPAQHDRILGHIGRGEPIPDDFMIELGVTPP